MTLLEIETSKPITQTHKMKTEILITDEQSLIGAKTRFGNSIPVYDQFGKLFIHRDSMGISGIVRAATWEDAYGICEDEFFPEASETIEEIRKDYNFTREHVKELNPDGSFKGWKTVETPSDDENAFMDNALFQEAFGFRPNGPNTGDVQKHGIYAKDLNGDSLQELTPELLAELEITLEIK